MCQWKSVSTLRAVLLFFTCVGLVASQCDDIEPDDATFPLNTFDDGPTSDKSAGIGVEFEASGIVWLCQDKSISFKDWSGAKGKIIDGRQGANWKLTADTTTGQGMVTSEYILDGTQIKIGTGAAAAAAQQVVDDARQWNPGPDRPAQIADTPGPWSLLLAAKIENVEWSRQITVPMPLEAINDVIQKSKSGTPHSLVSPFTKKRQNFVLVTHEFFQLGPNGIDQRTVGSDVLGFFSLVLTYAKAANKLPTNQSPKELSSIMPRTDFQEMFRQIKDGITVLDWDENSLYQLVKVLACWENDEDDALQIVVDDQYCDVAQTGEGPKLIPKDTLDNMAFEFVWDKATDAEDNKRQTVKISDWINGLQAGTGDLLAQADRNVIDGQIGGLGSANEYVLNTDRLVPLFEFRDLGGSQLSEFVDLVTAAESDIIALHQQYDTAPRTPVTSRQITSHRSPRREYWKRQDASACAITSSPANTISSPTTTIAATTAAACSLQMTTKSIVTACVCQSTVTKPPLHLPFATDPAESCHFTSPATATTAPTLAGKAVVWLSNNSVSVGTADDSNGGTDLRNAVYKGLKALCPDDKQECNTLQPYLFSGAHTIIDEAREDVDISFTFQDSGYNSTTQRDRMLSIAVAMWEGSMSSNNSCRSVPYLADGDSQNGCEGLQVKRDGDPVLRTRMDPTCQDNTCVDPKRICQLNATLCSAPNHITVQIQPSGSSEYIAHMNIEIELETKNTSPFTEFLCDILVNGMMDFAMFVAPELAGTEIFTDLDLEAICAGALEGKTESFGDAIQNLLGGDLGGLLHVG